MDAVVEGSVERSVDRVRIRAQLIHAADDRHLWAESYERDARDVLALQDEVARTIANEIRVKLTPQEQAGRLGRAPLGLDLFPPHVSVDSRLLVKRKMFR